MVRGESATMVDGVARGAEVACENEGREGKGEVVEAEGEGEGEI